MKPRLLLVIAAMLQLVWGLVPSASRFVIAEIPIELYIALRWSISGALFALYLFATKGWKAMSLSDLGATSILGILGYGVASFGALYGLKTGGVTNFAFMGAMGPIVTSAVAIAILKERPAKTFFFALPFSVLGLVCVALGKSQLTSYSVAGASLALIFLSYFLEAVVFAFSKRFRAKVSVIQYLAVAQLSAAAWLWLLQATAFQQTSALGQLTLKGFIAASFVSIVACVLCYIVLYWLLNHMDGHRLALFDGFHSLSAALFGFALFHEPLSSLMIAGGLLITIGVALGNWPLARAPETNRPCHTEEASLTLDPS